MSWTLRAEETRVSRIARQNERVQEARTPTCPPYRRAKNSVAQLSWGAISAPHNAAVAWSITRNSSEATSMAKQHADHIIVVGAGAAGLMTARELGRVGKRVTILRDRCGGRIHPLPVAEFGCSAEGGRRLRLWRGARIASGSIIAADKLHCPCWVGQLQEHGTRITRKPQHQADKLSPLQGLKVVGPTQRSPQLEA